MAELPKKPERRPLIVLDIVGLTPSLVGPDTPNLAALAREGTLAPLECPFPALTLPSQASILTGALPRDHGIVANGWYWRDLAEVHFWRQPHALLQAEDLPTRLRRERPGFTVAKLFWWFNMYAPVDWAVTPRPMYPADGRKVPDINTHPSELREELQHRFGTFPLFRFWGPGADLVSSRWITDASLSIIAEKRPSLSLVYLPHLDYDYQRFGPDAPEARAALRAIDGLASEFLALARRMDATVVVLSEYGIVPVKRPVHLNRVLRGDGLLAVREELGTERLDCGASRAFAVSDHQIAHIYVRDLGDLARVRSLLEGVPGVERVIEGETLAAEGLVHDRSGELLAVAEPDAWFTYYFWTNDDRAPDYARTVDIHRKPGYDPVELFLDPAIRFPKLRIGRLLAARKLGFRTLMDVISLDATLVRGSHGRRAATPSEGPLLLTSIPLPEVDPSIPFPLRSLPGLLASLAPS